MGTATWLIGSLLGSAFVVAARRRILGLFRRRPAPVAPRPAVRRHPAASVASNQSAMLAVQPTAQRAPAVARQHLELLQGGLISESSLESAKSEFGRMLEQGHQFQVEARLQPGLQFVVHVRALAELGTEAAGRVLDRQIGRSLSDDALEQAWYGIDLASGLRRMRRRESLPRLLAFATEAMELPLCHLLGAEVTAFPGFGDAVLSSDPAVAGGARRVLAVTLEGLRVGTVPLSLLVEAKLGDLLRRVFDREPPADDSHAARLALEVNRHLRRREHVRLVMEHDPAWRDALERQYTKLALLERVCPEYLERAARALPARLAAAPLNEQAEILSVLATLRRPAEDAALPIALDRRHPHRAAAIACLTWSAEPRVRDAVLALANEAFPARPGEYKCWGQARERIALLRALHRHGGAAPEKILLRVVRQGEPTLRLHAVRALGWWGPFDAAGVVGTLQQASLDAHPEIRQRAVAALARLGDRAALQEARERLSAESLDEQRAAMQLIVEEGLSWLWPDLDRLADAEDPEVCFLAREAAEQMREECLGPLG